MINDLGLNIIKNAEGLRLAAYQDSVGKWTIGYGHTGSDVTPDLKISEDQAEDLLKKDLEMTENAVSRLVTDPINSNEFSALVSFTFNLGQGTLSHSTLLQLLNAGDHSAAAPEFLKWVHAGGKVLDGLVKRRQAEHDLFLTPVEV